MRPPIPIYRKPHTRMPPAYRDETPIDLEHELDLAREFAERDAAAAEHKAAERKSEVGPLLQWQDRGLRWTAPKPKAEPWREAPDPPIKTVDEGLARLGRDVREWVVFVEADEDRWAIARGSEAFARAIAQTIDRWMFENEGYLRRLGGPYRAAAEATATARHIAVDVLDETRAKAWGIREWGEA